MFIDLNDLLLVAKALNEEKSGIELPEVHTKNDEIFKMAKTRREKARSESPLKPVELQTT